MNIRPKWPEWNKYPLLQRFFTAAMQANSAPSDYVYEGQPTITDPEKLGQAERELEELTLQLVGDFDPDKRLAAVYGLGYCADQGWTMQVTGEDGETRTDLLAYTLLEQEY